MSYEVVTLRGAMPGCCRMRRTDAIDPTLGIVPIAVVGLKTVGKLVVGKIFGSIMGDPEKRARAAAADAVAAARSPAEKTADAQATMAAFRARGLGTALDQVLGRKAGPGKLPRGMNPVAPGPSRVFSPAVMPAPTPVVATPLPSDSSQAYMDTPQTMTASAGGASYGAGADSDASAETKAAVTPSPLPFLPLIIGGVILLAFSRPRRQR